MDTIATIAQGYSGGGLLDDHNSVCDQALAFETIRRTKPNLKWTRSHPQRGEPKWKKGRNDCQRKIGLFISPIG